MNSFCSTEADDDNHLVLCNMTLIDRQDAPTKPRSRSLGVRWRSLHDAYRNAVFAFAQLQPGAIPPRGNRRPALAARAWHALVFAPLAHAPLATARHVLCLY
jgi:hypothetical protein